MNNEKRIKFGCYAVNVAMAGGGNIAPLLFLTFRNLYGISYSLLGLLVLVNFCTQLIVDLIFSFLSHKFNIPQTVKLTPALTVIGLALFALLPTLFPQYAYLGLLLGTIVASASGGLAEVLISPTIAALPSDNPDHEMSKLHSVYAWGLVGVIVAGTLFLLAFGGQNWQWLALLFALPPLVACACFFKAKFPEMQTPEKTSGALAFFKEKGLWLCVTAIFVGGASECTMSQWSSSYVEQALGIPKVWGDLFGVALFGVFLGLGRSLYAKYGKNIEKLLFFSAFGATACYLTAAISPLPVIGLFACALTGLCTAMMWPGSLIIASDKFPRGGVFIYAMMASGGDLGASVAPQLVGLVTDGVLAASWSETLAQSLGIGVEQLAMKSGMLTGLSFPLAAIFVFGILYAQKRKRQKSNANLSQNL